MIYEDEVEQLALERRLRSKGIIHDLSVSRANYPEFTYGTTPPSNHYHIMQKSGGSMFGGSWSPGYAARCGWEGFWSIRSTAPGDLSLCPECASR